MIREYLHFGSFHKELKRTIVDILEESSGEIILEELKATVKERKGHTLQETIMTYEQAQQRDLKGLFRYRDGIVYQN